MDVKERERLRRRQGRSHLVDTQEEKQVERERMSSSDGEMLRWTVPTAGGREWRMLGRTQEGEGQGWTGGPKRDPAFCHSEVP